MGTSPDLEFDFIVDRGIANVGEGRDRVQGSICLDLEILGTFTIRFSSHECQRPQEEIASRTYLRYLVIDLSQQSASRDTSGAGVVVSMLAVGMSGH